MNFYLLLLLLITILSILILIYFICYNKLKKYNERIIKAENIIDTQLNKKLELIIEFNKEVKKITGKKDYLKEYINLKNMIITNIEKDIKLSESEKLVNDLILDFNDLNKDESFKKLIANLREVNEILISAKNVYNENAMLSNNLIKTFPNNVVAKIAKFNIRSYYNNKADDETF